MESEEFKLMRDKALEQLRTGQSLTGKDGVFAPLLKELDISVILTPLTGYDSKNMID